MLLILANVAFAAPSFSVERGVFDEAFTLVLTADSGGTLYYSTDFSVPSRLYTEPLLVETTTTVRAIEVDDAGVASEIDTHTYIFPADVLTAAVMDPAIVNDAVYGPIAATTLHDLPSVSLVVPTGLTMTEAAASLEWIDPAGESSVVPVGAAIVGGTSYVYPKSSVRLSFRAEYGEGSWDFDPFGSDATGVQPAEHHDQLTLRSGNHDTVHYLGARGQQLRNLWMDESKLEMGRLSLHGRFVHLYENGQYFGVYHLRERGDAAFMANYLGGSEDDYEAINGGSAFDGAGSAWAALVAASGDYETAKQWLNVGDFLDYMILNYYAANAWDWTYNHNWIAAGPVQANQGGFVFQSSDSDICLYYDYNTNILNQGGPSNVFAGLMAESHPDFRVAWADAIHRNLEGDGALTATNAGDRYARLAALLEEPVIADSARWSYGWWTPPVWAAERDNLLANFFPYRTNALLGQVRGAGWYPLPAPVFSLPGGVVEAGSVLNVSVPAEVSAEVWVSVNGEDPRESGGAVAASAVEGPADYPIDRGRVVQARLKAGSTWGPLETAFYEVDAPPALVLNEWNAVDDDRELAEGDDALGVIPGNGGDWFELLVLEDADLRGWTFTMADRRGDRGVVSFTNADLLGSVRAGTLITVSASLPEDASYNPEVGDWRFHLRATPEGAYAQSGGFEVTAHDWLFTAWDADRGVGFGPAGETVAPESGIAGDEVGFLAADPSDGLRRTSSDFRAGARSTYGAPNVWGNGNVQDLSALRGESQGGIVDLGGDSGTAPVPAGGEDPPAAADCGCSGTSGAGAPTTAVWLAAGTALLLILRRRMGVVPLLAGCSVSADPVTVGDSDAPIIADCFFDADGDGAGTAEQPLGCDDGGVALGDDCDDGNAEIFPTQSERCNGVDDNCDGSIDENPVDGLPFWEDADADGYGNESAIVAACARASGWVVVGGDCNDADAAIHPGATERCDEIDQDCDGLAGDALGLTAECPADSCLAILTEDSTAADAPYWLTLPSGEVFEVWCDQSGGGWMLGFLRNSAHTGSQPDFGGEVYAIEGLATSPAEASASAVSVLSGLDLNGLDWSELRLGGYGNGAVSYVSRSIPRNELRIEFGADGYLLYGGASGYYWCGGAATYTDAGSGATNNPEGATPDCKGHGSLGSGWDFSEYDWANGGLTVCGGDGSAVMTAYPGSGWTYFGGTGAAQAIWVR